jgi:hypothetical protein
MSESKFHNPFHLACILKFAKGSTDPIPTNFKIFYLVCRN